MRIIVRCPFCNCTIIKDDPNIPQGSTDDARVKKLVEGVSDRHIKFHVEEMIDCARHRGD